MQFLRNKKFFIALASLVSVFIIGLVASNLREKQDFRSSAATVADRVDLILEPSTSDVVSGSTFTVNVVVDSSLGMSGVHFTLEHDPAMFRAVELKSSNVFPQTFIGPTVTDNAMALTIGASGGNAIRGRHVVATATYEAIGNPGTSQIRLRNNNTPPQPEPEVTAIEFEQGDTNRVNFDTLQPLTITIRNEQSVITKPPPQRIRGDANNDQTIGLADFNICVATFNQNVSPNTGCDFNGDGRVGLGDINAVITAFVTQVTGNPPQPTGLEFEAESGEITAPFQSGDGYIFQTTRNTGSISGGGVAHYTVNIPQAGQYAVQGLVCAPSADENSLFIDFDADPANNEIWIIRPTGSGCEWQIANWRLGGGAESPALDPVIFNLTQGSHTLHIHGREPNTKMDKFRILQSGTIVPTGVIQPTTGPQPTSRPTSGPQPTARPTGVIPTSPPTTPVVLPTVTGDFACGVYPNANPGCRAISYQAWMRDVPGTGTTVSVPNGSGGSEQRFVETMNVNFTPLLCHWHIDYNVPYTDSKRSAMAIPVNFTKYNCPDPNNPEWMRAQDQGSTYEQFNVSFPACQSGPFEGKECKSQHVFHVRQSEFNHCTEIRFSPNDGNSPIADGRWYDSTNWQTCPGYRSSWELTNRENSGAYLRMILPEADKYLNGNDSIPTVSGNISIPVKTSGGTGGRMKVFVFMDPDQHKTVYGTQTGYTLMEHDGFFNGNFTWDTRTLPAGKLPNGQSTPTGTRTPNGVHKFLFILMEGNAKQVKASGINLMMNVQNP